MYIALYNENRQHMANITDVSYDLTERVYDFDSFTATGKCEVDVNAAKFIVLNDDYGNYIYSCFVDHITPEDNTRTIKGLDFRTVFDTEVLLDYTQTEAPFDARLSAIFTKVVGLVVNDPDIAVQKIPLSLSIPSDTEDTSPYFGEAAGTYSIINAYAYLKGYLKYYGYNITARFNVVTEKIDVAFIKTDAVISIGLKDFTYELQTTATATNKAVATIEYKPDGLKYDEDGNAYIEGENGEHNAVEPRPARATKYYYRTQNNDIVVSDSLIGDIEGRIYPVYCKYFEAQFLAQAQYDAIAELANARFVDNIIIDHNKIIDPIDLSGVALYTKVALYLDGMLYKTLPVSEKQTKADSNGVNVKIKLGFKKILLTEIIKDRR